jgi:hypothetical protein
MTGRLCAALAVAAFCAGAWAQVPSQTAPSTNPAGATTTLEQDKRGTAAPAQTQRSANTRPGASPLPMNIKIQGEGIKLPDCTAESREGEACKK